MDLPRKYADPLITIHGRYSVLCGSYSFTSLNIWRHISKLVACSLGQSPSIITFNLDSLQTTARTAATHHLQTNQNTDIESLYVTARVSNEMMVSNEIIGFE